MLCVEGNLHDTGSLRCDICVGLYVAPVRSERVSVGDVLLECI